MTMSIIMPIIIPIHSEPDYCPKCGKEENIKTVCAHCGHVYIKKSTSWWKIPITFLVVIFIVVVFLGVLITIVTWLVNGDISLFETLKNQWKWFNELRVW